MLKKILSFISFLLCISLLISLNSFAITETETENKLVLPEGYGIIKNHNFSTEIIVSPELYYSSDGVTYNSQEYYFGSLLSSINKPFYDKLVNITPKDEVISVDFGRELTEDEFDEINIYYIWDAVFLDCPEIFWINGANITYDERTEKTGFLKRTRYYSNFKVELVFDSTYENPQATYDKLWKTLKGLDFKSNNRYEFVKKVHDYLVNRITYGGDFECPTTYDPVGALLNGVCVCQGYAEAFKMICDYYKIPAICVIGEAGNENHMWNAVKMDNGYWYLVDATWDDQEEDGLFYDFFLTGLSSEAPNFNCGKFSESHEMIYQHKYKSLLIDGLTLKYPSLSYSAYNTERFTQNTAFSVNEPNLVDAERNRVYYSIFDDLDAVYYNGLWVDTSTKSTNTKITVSSGSDYRDEQWTLALYGDLNGDGEYSAEDFSIVINTVLNSEYDENDITTVLADANGDTALDVLDVMAYELARHGYCKF